MPDPASAFYEWTVDKADGRKNPWHIHLFGDAPFSFAGVWARNDRLEVTSCSIITMPAGDPMSELHDRRYVILDPLVHKEWLHPATPGAKAKELFEENVDDRLEFHGVSREVNSSRFEGKSLREVNPL